MTTDKEGKKKCREGPAGAESSLPTHEYFRTKGHGATEVTGHSPAHFPLPV